MIRLKKVMKIKMIVAFSIIFMMVGCIPKPALKTKTFDVEVETLYFNSLTGDLLIYTNNGIHFMVNLIDGFPACENCYDKYTAYSYTGLAIKEITASKNEIDTSNLELVKYIEVDKYPVFSNLAPETAADSKSWVDFMISSKLWSYSSKDDFIYIESKIESPAEFYVLPYGHPKDYAVVVTYKNERIIRFFSKMKVYKKRPGIKAHWFVEFWG